LYKKIFFYMSIYRRRLLSRPTAYAVRGKTKKVLFQTFKKIRGCQKPSWFITPDQQHRVQKTFGKFRYLAKEAHYLTDEGRHLTDEGLHLTEEGLHLTDEGLPLTDEGLHLTEERLPLTEDWHLPKIT
jgi:hypothetical protein